MKPDLSMAERTARNLTMAKRHARQLLELDEKDRAWVIECTADIVAKGKVEDDDEDES